MKFSLTNNDLLDFQTYIITSSKKAKRMQIFNTIGIFTELMVVCFLVDILLKTSFITIIGVFLGIAWLVFYPKFLRKKQLKILKSLKISTDKKDFILNINKTGFTYEDENFKFDEISNIIECANIYILNAKQKLYLIIAKNAQTQKAISEISKNSNKLIARYEKLSYENFINNV
ncbi:hypothetical protein [Campylobacter majalis]|uniref:hypothetical protein n=1 Tax=Campylobacter majalis TaxID=2790656 RepID=UPI003D694A7A